MMKVGLKYWRCCLVLVTVAMALLETTATFASSNPNPGVFPPDSQPYGLTYGQWSNAWWQWLLSVPASVSPLLDTTGVDCSQGQSGPVWFLAGTPGGPPVTRNCTIPAGKALFFPLVNVLNTNLGCPTAMPPIPPTTFTVQELHEQADHYINTVYSKNATVDGVKLQDLKSYRAETDETTFSVTLPSDNLFGCPGLAGTQSGLVSDGYYLMLKPLSPGEHVISFGGQAGGTHLIPGISTQVTYNLTVQP